MVGPASRSIREKAGRDALSGIEVAIATSAYRIPTVQSLGFGKSMAAK